MNSKPMRKNKNASTRGYCSVNERIEFGVAMDKLQIPNKEQKELLAIAESTRPQIVLER